MEQPLIHEHSNVGVVGTGVKVKQGAALEDVIIA